MKVAYRVTERCSVDLEVPDLKMLFQFLAKCDSLFGVERCGNCESDHLSFQYRTPKGYEYYSIRCEDCHYELKFGQRQDDKQLFAKGWEEPYRKDEDSQVSTSQDASEYSAAGQSPPF